MKQIIKTILIVFFLIVLIVLDYYLANYIFDILNISKTLTLKNNIFLDTIILLFGFEFMLLIIFFIKAENKKYNLVCINK